MNKYILAFSMILCTFTAFAGMDKYAVKISNVATSDTADTVTSPYTVDGYVLGVSAVFDTNNIPVKMAVKAVNPYTGISRTIYENTSGVSTNFSHTIIYPVQDNAGADIADEYVRMPLIGDTIKIETSEATDTNQTVLINFYYERVK